VDLDLFIYRPRLEEMAARAAQAEREGFDGLLVAESVHDPFQALAVASPHTERVTLGTAVALAFPRSPMVLAIAAWDLQRASDGRFVLGLGAQVRRHVERRFGVPYGRPVERMREYVEAVRHIWGAFQGRHRLEFHGPTYQLDFLPEAVNPGPLACGPPTIFLAAVGPRMYELAGAVADGAFVHPMHSTEYLESVAEPAIARGLRQSRRRREDFALAATAIAIVGKGEQAVAQREEARRQLAFYASTPAYEPVLDLAGHGALGKTLRALMRAGKIEAMAPLIQDDLLEALSVSADTWSDAAAVGRLKYGSLVDRLAFYSAPPCREPA
jgi:probable F420-dependent oxidoreductase